MRICPYCTGRSCTGSWLKSLSKDKRLFLCLVLAHEVHRQLGKEKWMWKTASKDKQNTGETGVFYHGAKYTSGPRVREPDPAARSARGPAAAPGQQGGLQISNNMPDSRRAWCLASTFQASKQSRWPLHLLHFLNLVQNVSWGPH